MRCLFHGQFSDFKEQHRLRSVSHKTVGASKPFSTGIMVRSGLKTITRPQYKDSHSDFKALNYYTMNATLMKRLFRVIQSGTSADVDTLCRRIVEEEKKQEAWPGGRGVGADFKCRAAAQGQLEQRIELVEKIKKCKK
jgi:hypothetical protein